MCVEVKSICCSFLPKDPRIFLCIYREVSKPGVEPINFGIYLTPTYIPRAYIEDCHSTGKMINHNPA